MKKFFATAAAMTAMFVAACTPSDPNMPARYVDVPAPEWVNSLRDIRVSKTSAYVTNAQGQRFKVTRSGTDIGNGLTATRDAYDLYITDKNGVKCNWNSAERLEWCRKPNPAYQEYVSKHQPK